MTHVIAKFPLDAALFGVAVALLWAVEEQEICDKSRRESFEVAVGCRLSRREEARIKTRAELPALAQHARPSRRLAAARVRGYQILFFYVIVCLLFLLFSCCVAYRQRVSGLIFL